MLKNKPQADLKAESKKEKVKNRTRFWSFAFLLLTFSFAVGCRYDMQDQPRYKAYKQSDFFADKRASRDLPAGTVPRGQLRANKQFYTGKKENADPNAPVQTTTDASGNTLISTFPNDIVNFSDAGVEVTEALLDRGEERYKVFCIVCHGPVGEGDGMIVRRGFTKPPTYNDDRLRNAPVGHFYDVITNGQGRMNSYASQIPVADRWAIVAYIRALQLSQNPDGAKTLPMTNSNTNTASRPANTNTAPRPATSPNAATNGGVR
jgi:mono/diheme cytochrome c family protein